ncbi:DinB family protein [Paraburkholderia acidicola]|uniref:DinB family protein n=1 Tax=Paraburkholderia acidicola TaxID=1912599 RepID=A0ABV1LRG0_9BURK
MTTTRRAYVLNQLREMPDFLERAFLGMPRHLLTRVSANDHSPLIEHLWHVRDCESDLYGPRIERVLAEVGPRLEPMDVSGWPAERRYDLRDGDQAVREFIELRSRLVAQLETVADINFERTGIRHDGSEADVYFLIEQLADHDRDHRWRMCSILKEAATSSAQSL